MQDLLEKTLQAAQKGRKYAFATVVESTIKGTPQKAGAKMVVLEDGTIFGTIGGGKYEKEAQKECLKAIKRRKSTLVTYDCFGKEGQPVCGGQMKVFIEPFGAPRHLVICGAGHIGLALSALGKILEFKVTVLDNRKEFANKKRFPHVDEIMAGPYNKTLDQITPNLNTYLVIATHGHLHDFECLRKVIRSDAAYIGVIGSLKKRQGFLKQLKKLGVSTSRLKKVYMPTGLDIGAQTPQEIAISIMAEIVTHSNRDFLGSAKFETK
ncbi:MAG: XdhC/CoxI family protein [Candidatus Omnitrophota bacterium]